MMSDDFQGFNKQGKKTAKTTPAAGLTTVGKQLFFRLQDSAPITLTPAEKAALLDLYKKAYPAFYRREIERVATEHGVFMRGLRVGGWIVVGLLVGFMLVVVWRMF